LSPRAVTRLRSIDRRHLFPGLAAFAAALAVALLGIRAGAEPSGRVEVQILGVNDFHGHLERGARLAGWLDHDTSAMPKRTIRVHAGDMVGASPLTSSYFHDEPTIRALDLMRFDVGALGNHEFDEGGHELLRLLRGGRRTGPAAFKTDASGSLVNTSDPSFGGVRFPVLAANSIGRDGRPLLPPYTIIERGGVRVGFIGVVTPTTPRYLLPSHAHEFRYLDMSDTVNRWVPVLRRKGVEAIVVLAHSGAVQHGGAASGEVIDETRQMSDAVDVVVAGHTHSPLDLRVPNSDGRGDKLVVQAWSYGVGYDRVRLTIDRRTGDVVRKRARLQRTEAPGARPNAPVAALVARYRRRVAPVANRVVMTSSRSMDRDALAPFVADAQRSAGHADFAFVNPGETRDGLPSGKVTYADLFQSQAYEFPLVRMRLRGVDIERLLDQRWRGGSFTPLAMSGRRSLDPKRRYTVVANELIADGDRFPALHSGTDRERIGTDLQALVRWLTRPAGARATESRAASRRSRSPARSRRSR
jgi:5'-nucleotidase